MNPFITFEVIGQNVMWAGGSMLSGSGNGSSWQVLHFWVLVDSILTSLDTMCHERDDRQTHTHTDRQTKWSGQKHQLFSKVS